MIGSGTKLSCALKLYLNLQLLRSSIASYSVGEEIMSLMGIISGYLKKRFTIVRQYFYSSDSGSPTISVCTWLKRSTNVADWTWRCHSILDGWHETQLRMSLFIEDHMYLSPQNNLRIALPAGLWKTSKTYCLKYVWMNSWLWNVAVDSLSWVDQFLKL